MAASNRYKTTWALIVVATVYACALKPPPVPAPAELISDRPPAKPLGRAESGDTSAHPSSGLVVHIDPVTGRIVPKPPATSGDPLTVAPQLQSTPAPDTDFVEEASPVPGGGVKVNLKRRFHQPLIATTKPDGGVSVEHRPAVPETESK
jgi:hypothetical protein